MKKKKTIIFLAPTPPPYMGVSVVTEIILNSRFVDEFNVIHIDTADRRPLNNMGKIDFTNIYLALKHYFLLLKNLLFSDAELVYIPISQTTIGYLRDMPFIIISKLFDKKVILHLHGGYFRKFYNSCNIIMKHCIQKTLKITDRMIVLGNTLKALFDGLLPKDKLSVVPNGLNLPLDIKTKDFQKDGIIVLFLANLIETKGYKEVLYSVKKVIQYYTNIKFIFAGLWINDNEKKECMQYLEKKRIKQYVKFIGPVVGSDKLNLLKEADIFVFPTYYPMEGHPLVIIEAMAAGLPIITTDTGCIKECVIDGENGFIIPKKNPDAIAEKIIYFIEHPEERKRMGRRGRELYEQKFTKEHFIQRMIEVFKAVLEG